jgi:lysophospholipase L1-like esterase
MKSSPLTPSMIISRQLLVTLIFLCTITCNSFAQEQPYRIMPLGNSITQSNQDNYSYRYNLWKKLLDAKVNCDFVGSHNTNKNGNPVWPAYQGMQFDNDNEGHWGWSADQILNGNTQEPTKGKLSDWLKGYTPDIVLMHLGTNDMFRNHSVPATLDELREVVRLIREKNPAVTILLAKLIPAYDQKVGPQSANNIKLLNDELPALALELNTIQSPVILVDQNTGFDPKTGIDTWDGIHPNASGEEKMAQKWFNAIMKIVNATPVTYSSFDAELTQERDIQLNWATLSEKGNDYFEVLRALNSGEFITVGNVPGAGTSSQLIHYSFKDTTAPFGVLTYKLKQVSLNRKSSFSDTMTVEKKQILSSRTLEPKAIQLLTIYPSIGLTRNITVHLQSQKPFTEVSVAIFNSEGKLIEFRKTICKADGSVEEKLQLDPVTKAGLYLVQAVAGEQVLKGKFLLVQ